MADTTIDVLDAAGKKSGTVELPGAIFDATANVPLLHQVVTAQLAAARQGTHKAKNRGEVSGSGRKPFKQKGTGRARQGSVRMPQHTGGGVVHGPVPRDYAQRTPKKMIAAALLGAISDRARGGRVHVVSSLIEGELPSTKQAAAAIAQFSDARNVLVVIDRSDDLALKSVRNLPSLHVIFADQLNAYDVLVAQDILFTKQAFDAFVESKTATAPVAAVAPAASESVVEADAEHAEGAAPLADGTAPAGYDIKGNKDSMLFHRPEGRWYESTVAEVWFRTAEDAEAAGFTEAGANKEGK